jgi:hypothetical protein
MHYQCAPDPDQVLAQRRLSDGRVLAVFHDPRTEQRVVTERAVHEVEASGGRVLLEYERPRVATFKLPGDDYFLVITDDAGEPEKWRTLCSRATEDAIRRAFLHFREGDDERRINQAEVHPRRRATD